MSARERPDPYGRQMLTTRLQYSVTDPDGARSPSDASGSAPLATPCSISRRGRTGMRDASLLHAEDIAAMLGVSKAWVYAEVRAGRIPCVRLGRYVRFRRESIEGWLCEIETGTIR
jgi:excisionase family DNA binding protein